MFHLIPSINRTGGYPARLETMIATRIPEAQTNGTVTYAGQGLMSPAPGAAAPKHADLLREWNELLAEAEHPSTVLVVDGIEINRRLVRAALKSTCYQIREVHRPSDALDV